MQLLQECIKEIQWITIILIHSSLKSTVEGTKKNLFTIAHFLFVLCLRPGAKQVSILEMDLIILCSVLILLLILWFITHYFAQATVEISDRKRRHLWRKRQDSHQETLFCNICELLLGSQGFVCVSSQVNKAVINLY